MSLHKLTAGSGYDYLTRQVAALDATDKGHTGLATYYSERGESPGVWIGTGLAGIDGLNPGDVVTAEQMFLLFGLGYHPLAMDQIDTIDASNSPSDWQQSGRLGQPFKVYDNDVTAFQVEVACRVTAAGTAVDKTTGRSISHQVSAGERAAIRTQVAREFYVREHGRAPASQVDLSSYIALNSRPKTTAVAGYDLTFSPVKSISTLWAVADKATAATIERAHQHSVRDALAFIEKHVLFTRTGRNGVRQVQVTGLVATAFTHRDSRNGDPDLHTHVAVANKVQTLPEPDGTPGRWLSIDGRVLHKAIVAASETYNTRLEHHLTAALGVRFAERAAPGDRLRGAKRSVREIVGVDPALNRLWSTRRAQIVDRQTDLAGAFRREHGRPPTPVEATHLGQQANLETRQAKHSARSLDEQRTTWHAEATELLGGGHAIEAMVDRALSPAREHPARVEGVDARWVDATARRVISELEERRETWQTWHVRAEAERQLRAANLTVTDPDAVVDRLVDHAVTVHSVSLAGPTDADLGIHEPPQLRRHDGSSVYDVVGLTHYTSQRILDAEQRLLHNAGLVGAPAVPEEFVDLAIEEAAAHGTPLDTGQARLVREMATSTRRVQVAIAPAGTGKTTALRALAAAWTDAGGQVLGLAPSAAAAAVLRDALDPHGRGAVHADTLTKLTHTLDTNPRGGVELEWVTSIGPDTLVLIDEAGMADTLTLNQVVHHALTTGATVRLVGDDQQLAAVGAGGILRDLAHKHGALRLDELHRFTDPAEADATRGLRDGNTYALEFYLDNDRVHVGDQFSILDDLHTAWAHDREAGLDSLMLAPTSDQVRDLNQRAQTARQAAADGDPDPGGGVRLADDLTGHVGDTIITRTNDRRLAISATDWVKNGDRWTITNLHTDGPRAGGLDVRHTRTGLRAHLPADYVRNSVELGYATTIHAAQGVTAVTVHGLTASGQTRQELYTMLTRGRHNNHVYVPAEATTGDPHDLIAPGALAPRTAMELLATVLANDGAAVSATHQLELENDPARLHEQAVERCEDALRFACEDLMGPLAVRLLEAHTEHRVPGIQDQPAWPTLRAHLIHAAADGYNPARLLDTVVSYGQIDTAADAAAVLDWRLSGITHPWNDGIAEPDPVTDPLPRRLARHPTWGPYLHSRQALATPPQAATLKLPMPTLHEDAAVHETAAPPPYRPEDHMPLVSAPRSHSPSR